MFISLIPSLNSLSLFPLLPGFRVAIELKLLTRHKQRQPSAHNQRYNRLTQSKHIYFSYSDTRTQTPIILPQRQNPARFSRNNNNQLDSIPADGFTESYKATPVVTVAPLHQPRSMISSATSTPVMAHFEKQRSIDMRAPTLTEVLRNQAPPPYTLTAFMAFLSQNHCLETLEFILDASRYQACYFSLSQIPPIPGSEESQQLRMSWDRLINSYIRPGAAREVNLVSTDRQSLLRIPNTYTPPAPNALDSAVYKITELMRESVLSPFLVACQQKLREEQAQCMTFYPQMIPTQHQQQIPIQQMQEYNYNAAQRSQLAAMYNQTLPPRPPSTHPTSVPQQQQQQEYFDQSDDDVNMSGSDDPMTPPQTPPSGSGSNDSQWKKTKTLFQKMGRAKSKEP